MTETMISKSNILKKLIFVLVLAVLPLAMPGAWAAGIPQLINYQGTLTNAAGSPVPDGSYQVRFAIYNVATAGTPLWQETWSATTTPITTSKGNFSVMLGSLVAIPATFFSVYPVTYLGVKVGADAEMLPRQRIASVAYAFHAGDGIPKGGIIMWSGSADQIPAGWILCNGQVGTPDLRDKFIVGSGGSYSTGSMGGEATHTLTVAELPSHTHSITDPGHRHNYYKPNQTGAYIEFTPDPISVRVDPLNGTTENANTGITIQNTGSGAAHENRPPYYALAFIMKL